MHPTMRAKNFPEVCAFSRNSGKPMKPFYNYKMCGGIQNILGALFCHQLGYNPLSGVKYGRRDFPKGLVKSAAFHLLHQMFHIYIFNIPESLFHRFKLVTFQLDLFHLVLISF